MFESCRVSFFFKIMVLTVFLQRMIFSMDQCFSVLLLSVY